RADSKNCSTDKLLLLQSFLLPAAQAGLFYGSRLQTTTEFPFTSTRVKLIGSVEVICTPT
ncbi:hypothetical protein PO461_23745, partial [Enterobacter asburiae]|uniref:hypothetical protein n=1 Tax=Enterobacter asburiae TaxID=61645 RepID=UPI002FF66AD6